MVKKNSTNVVSWEADEYLQRSKGALWYVGFAMVVLGLVVLSVVLKWWTFTALIVLSAVASLIYAVRPPRKLRYSLSDEGLTEGDRVYKYEEFKNFGVMQEDGKFAIVLTPRKRFSPRVTVFFPQESGEEIVDVLGVRLPMEEVKMDFLDKIIKILRI